jgi:acid phosphatase family membrane protein YuiD
MDFVHDLFLNYYFLTFIAASVLSISLKALLHAWKHRVGFSMKDGFQNGGMPSSHTAVVSALTFSLLFRTGLSDLFFISAIFASIIINDAVRIRKNVGLQGEKLNELLRKFDEKTIHVVYGHSIAQVFAGMLLGLGCAILFKILLS